MRIKSARVAVPNGVLCLEDERGGTPPHPVRGANLLATSSCIFVGCMIDSEGETEVMVGPADALDNRQIPLFDGGLETPSLVLVISTVEGTKILDTAVSSPNTRVKIWTNHPRWPDKVIISLE
jgi:hypothetical protein